MKIESAYIVKIFTSEFWEAGVFFVQGTFFVLTLGGKCGIIFRA